CDPTEEASVRTRSAATPCGPVRAAWTNSSSCGRCRRRPGPHRRKTPRSSRENVMSLIGYTMMCEQAGPKQLVRDVAQASEHLQQGVGDLQRDPAEPSAPVME